VNVAVTRTGSEPATMLRTDTRFPIRLPRFTLQLSCRTCPC